MFRRLLLAVLTVLVSLSIFSLRTPAQTPFADPAFQHTWERTDKPVADQKAARSWYWGPTPGEGITEPYKNAPGGQRLVQYFDKSRMEINNPAGPPNSPFYVTNGLPATELMTGRMQVGDADFEQRCAASIPLASDNDDPTGPTYATFGTLMNVALGNRVGQKATATTDRAGNVGTDAGKATVPGVELVYYDAITQHNIPKIFWDFLNARGPIYVNGTYTTGPINNPWFFAGGLPTTEAYWAQVKIGGQPLDVLIQGFERRVLTYIPAYNGTAFNVQMGNVGLHYYDWRYKGAGCAGPPPVTQPPATLPPAATQPPAATLPPTSSPLPATATPPPPPPSGECAAGYGITARAWVSNPNPTGGSVTVYGAICNNGQGLADIPMHTVWHYRTTTPSCDGQSGTDGVASCTRSIGNPTAGYTVVINVTFTVNGHAYFTSTSFTPR